MSTPCAQVLVSKHYAGKVQEESGTFCVRKQGGSQRSMEIMSTELSSQIEGASSEWMWPNLSQSMKNNDGN